MKRLPLIVAAIVALGGPMSASVALADQRQDRGPRWAAADQGERRGGGGGRWRSEPRGGAVRVEPNGAARGPRNERWEGPRREQFENNLRAPRKEFRRGGYLPPEAGAPVIEDHARYRLRMPPRGYTWVRVPGGYAMVSEATGQIFDMVPLR